jgi:hypothetical protein
MEFINGLRRGGQAPPCLLCPWTEVAATLSNARAASLAKSKKLSMQSMACSIEGAKRKTQRKKLSPNHDQVGVFLARRPRHKHRITVAIKAISALDGVPVCVHDRGNPAEGTHQHQQG